VARWSSGLRHARVSRGCDKRRGRSILTDVIVLLPVDLAVIWPGFPISLHVDFCIISGGLSGGYCPGVLSRGVLSETRFEFLQFLQICASSIVQDRVCIVKMRLD
jgi:hypothetical protein